MGEWGSLMNEIIPKFKSSIFDGAKDLAVDLAEVGIDSVLADGLLKDIPIVGALVGFAKIGQNLHDRNLLRQTLQFIEEFNSGDINEEKLEEYKRSIGSDSKKAEQELGRVLLLLNRTLELEKSQMLARLFENYLNKKLSWEEFCEFAEIVERLFLSDFVFVAKIYNSEITSTRDLALHPFKRLVSLGIVNESMQTLWGGSPHMRTDSYVNLSDMGEKFYMSVAKTARALP
jgi:hypothetical protein